MKADNPFDKKLELTKGIASEMLDALVDCVDTLDLAWAGVQSVFEERATPELAMSLLTEAMKERARNLALSSSGD